ncbi:MAG: 2,5-diamino-6-(ribosylamino)-4(3H)-pyrimidinone 5'-phosphate reductase [Chloroflexi bacterium]|nr:2,5-diamino-6-(ribosylamino)-4(3H)-pyrimidinone 5'-phosphate reductase [Chloroflexota bacterium]
MPIPFVFINVATTADGKLDTFERKSSSISSDADKARVLRLRAEADAVMVGGNTLINEDPKLTVKSAELRAERTAKGLPENPIKVGVVSLANIKPDGDFMQNGPARRIIFTTELTPPEQVKVLSDLGAEVHILGKKRVDLRKALETLYTLGVRRLMVEGGGTLNFELLRQGFVDELSMYIAPKIFGGQSAPSMATGHGLIESAGINLKLLDARALDETGGVLIRYQCLNKIY